MPAHKLVPLTLDLICICLLGKNPIFPHWIVNATIKFYDTGHRSFVCDISLSKTSSQTFSSEIPTTQLSFISFCQLIFQNVNGYWAPAGDWDLHAYVHGRPHKGLHPLPRHPHGAGLNIIKPFSSFWGKLS